MYENSSFDVPTFQVQHQEILVVMSYTQRSIHDGPTNTTVTLGIRNLEDKDPIIDSNRVGILIFMIYMEELISLE